MIDVYTWPTPNGHKVHIALEEMGLAYRIHGVNIRQGEQFKPEFLKISPNNRIPAIVDPEGPDGRPLSLFEVEVNGEPRFVAALAPALQSLRERGVAATLAQTTTD